MTTHQKRILRIIVLVGSTAICSSGITAFIMVFRATEGKEPIPHEIIQAELSPDGQTTAMLFSAHTGETWDILGAGRRVYLGIKIEEITYIIDRDLTEGFGTYEGGVGEIHWLNDHQVFVERIIADQPQDLIFDVYAHVWCIPEEDFQPQP